MTSAAILAAKAFADSCSRIFCASRILSGNNADAPLRSCVEPLLLFVAGNLLSVFGQPFTHRHIQDGRDAYLAHTGNPLEVGLQTGRQAPAINLRSHALQCSAFAFCWQRSGLVLCHYLFRSMVSIDKMHLFRSIFSSGVVSFRAEALTFCNAIRSSAQPSVSGEAWDRRVGLILRP